MPREYALLRTRRVPGTDSPFDFAFSPPSTPLAGEPLDIRLERARLSEREVVDAAGDPSIAAITPTMPTRLLAPVATSTDAAADDTGWGIRAVRADTSWLDGAGVTVAVLDTGIDALHPAFVGMGASLVEQDFTGSGSGDRHGHGTHCAGTIFGRDVDGQRIGVARGVNRALIGKVIGDTGCGRSDWLQEAVLWAEREGAHVIAMSIGLDFTATVTELVAEGLPVAAATAVALEHYRANLRAFDAMMTLLRARAAFRPGAVIVAASGNESERHAVPPAIPYRIAASRPSAAPGAIAIGAVEQRPAGLAVASFSNTFPQVCAPGVNIVSARAGGGLVSMSGTSMATPHAAGVAALWWQSLGTSTPELTVSTHLLASARRGGFASVPDPADIGGGIVTAPQ